MLQFMNKMVQSKHFPNHCCIHLLNHILKRYDNMLNKLKSAQDFAK